MRNLLIFAEFMNNALRLAQDRLAQGDKNGGENEGYGVRLLDTSHIVRKRFETLEVTADNT